MFVLPACTVDTPGPRQDNAWGERMHLLGLVMAHAGKGGGGGGGRGKNSRSLGNVSMTFNTIMILFTVKLCGYFTFIDTRLIYLW